MTRTLTQAINDAGGAVNLLRNSQAVPQVVPTVPYEYTNWISEQLALRDTCCLYDQSHHMVTIVLEGPDVIPFLERIGINSFANFPVNRAKQLVACAPNGYLIGQGILFHVSQNRMILVGPHPIMDWVEYQLAITSHTIKYTREGTSLTRVGDPRYFRYQLQGPTALDIMRDLLGEEPPELKFFHMDNVTIAGKSVTLLRHGMAGLPGFEFFGEWDDKSPVLEAVLTAGQAHGLKQAGSATYWSGPPSGYFPGVIPGIYTDPELADYRDWLTDTSWEATAPLGGSFESENIEDYYFTPFDVGYGKIVNLDHDFIGRAALQKMIENGAKERKKKVTLLWNTDDVVEIYRSLFTDDVPAKHIPLPLGKYSTVQMDKVLLDGKEVGVSGWISTSVEDKSVASIAILDAEAATEGAEVSLVWGESTRTDKIRVEPHKQVAVRATVAPSPLGEYARTKYRRNDISLQGA